MAESSQGMQSEQHDGVPLSQVPIGLIIRGVVAILFAVGLVGGLHGYLGLRLVSEPNLGQPWTALGWGRWRCSSSPSRWASRPRAAGPRALNQALYWTSMLWLGMFGLLLTAVLVADVVGAVWRPAGHGARGARRSRGARPWACWRWWCRRSPSRSSRRAAGRGWSG